MRQFGVDARCIPQSLIRGRGVIWFQCPYLPRGEGVCKLICDFLLNLAEQIEGGVCVCIGIANKFPYIKYYKLHKILGKNLAAEDNSTDVLKKYTFVGADNQLIKQILSFGYHHQTVHEGNDVHSKII